MRKQKLDCGAIPDTESGRVLKKAMEQFDFLPKPKRDQQFLVDDNVIAAMVKEVDIGLGSQVIEIGPGCGQITRHLLDVGCFVSAFEVDHELRQILGRIDSNRLSVCYEDAISADWPEAETIVSNLPFSICEPFILKAAKHECVQDMSLIVGFRLAHMLRPGAGVSKMKLILESFFEIVKKIEVSRDSFFPSPPQDCLLLVLRRYGLGGGGGLRRRFWRNFFDAEDTSIGQAIRGALPPLKRGSHISMQDLGIAEKELSWPTVKVSNQHLTQIDRAISSALNPKNKLRDLCDPRNW